VGNPRFSSIYVRIGTYERLKEFKNKLGTKTYSDVIDQALDALAKIDRLRIASVLCVKMATARATPMGWAKIFEKNGLPADAFYFLKAEGQNELVVDRDKCVQFFQELGLIYQPQAQAQGEQK